MIPIRFDNNDITGYQRWNYKWWYALAEFVDNSTHNYFANREALDRQFTLDDARFEIKITVDRDGDNEIIEIYDNAMGMDLEELIDSFDFGRKKENPGRSAYGLGMKTAAIWMGNRFEIETSKLGVSKKHFVVFDVERVANGDRSLNPNTTECDASLHYTKITVKNLTKRLRGRTVTKVKQYLSSIYRCDLRTDTVNIEYNGASLSWDLYDDDSFMTARDGTRYKQDFEFTTSSGKSVSGWFGIFAPGKGGRTKAGFSTIQNDRVIQGYPTPWRPEEVFGAEQAGTLVQQRLFGEFYFDDFQLSQTKDEILFNSDEEYDEIEDALKEATADYRGVASQTHRSLGLTGSGPSNHAVEDALESISQEIESSQAAAKLSIVPVLPPEVLKEQEDAVLERAQEAEQPWRIYRIGDTEVKLYFDDVSSADMYYVNESPSEDDLIVVVNRAHPHWCMLSNAEVTPYLRHCIIDGVAEHRAKQLSNTIEVNEQTVKKQKDDLLRLRFEILPE